uniref:RNase H type-1 domain-containing protein n=1 Tax=Triticum urartu TaxID=4572 RepID=A0A8R7R949_TRIUA
MQEDGSAAAGMILRNHEGGVIFAAYRCIFNCNDALEAELHAIMQGMALALQHSSLPIVVQSDSSTALAAMTGDSFVQVCLWALVLEIKRHLQDREFVPSKIKREQNRVAHRLAL